MIKIERISKGVVRDSQVKNSFKHSHSIDSEGNLIIDFEYWDQRCTRYKITITPAELADVKRAASLGIEQINRGKSLCLSNLKPDAD